VDGTGSGGFPEFPSCYINIKRRVEIAIDARQNCAIVLVLVPGIRGGGD
jgi:hypothetical protein